MLLGTVVSGIVALDGGDNEFEVAGVGPSNPEGHSDAAGTAFHIRVRHVVVAVRNTLRKGLRIRS